MPKAKKGRKVKVKAKRRKKMEYKCIGKNEYIVPFTYQKLNEHGAKDNIVRYTAYYCLVFEYSAQINRLFDTEDDTPKVLQSKFEIHTSDKSIYDSYAVNSVYKDLPTAA